MYYTLHHVQKYLVIHYIIYHLSFLLFYFIFKKSKEDKMQIKLLFLIVGFLNWH
jgi:hypothetical protein